MAPILRFDRGARYGAAIVAVCFGGYLSIATNFSAIVQDENYTGTIRTDVPLLNITQFCIVLGALVFGLGVLPTAPASRVGGVTLASVVLLLWATFGLEQGAGNITHPVAFWDFVLDQGFMTLVAAVGGWVIARGRHPLTWLVVIVAVVPAIISPILEEHNFTTGAYSLVTQGIVVVCGVGAVWLAALFDRLLEDRRRSRTAAATAPDESIVTAAS
ncbi:MAG: hypothetical protein ABWY55_01235 [Microbacterium sp.]